MPIIAPQTFTFIGVVVALTITPGATTMLTTSVWTRQAESSVIPSNYSGYRKPRI